MQDKVSMPSNKTVQDYSKKTKPNCWHEPELLVKIFIYMTWDFQCILRLRRVSKAWNEAVRCQTLWEYLCIRIYSMGNYAFHDLVINNNWRQSFLRVASVELYPVANPSPNLIFSTPLFTGFIVAYRVACPLVKVSEKMHTLSILKFIRKYYSDYDDFPSICSRSGLSVHAGHSEVLEIYHSHSLEPQYFKKEFSEFSYEFMNDLLHKYVPANDEENKQECTLLSQYCRYEGYPIMNMNLVEDLSNVLVPEVASKSHLLFNITNGDLQKQYEFEWLEQIGETEYSKHKGNIRTMHIQNKQFHGIIVYAKRFHDEKEVYTG